MKRIIALALFIIILLSSVSSALADEGFKVRGYLEWGMNIDEVMNAMKEEVHNGMKMCEGVVSFQSVTSEAVKSVAAKATLGEYTTFINCLVSDLWGLFSVAYDFSNNIALDEDEYAEWIKINDADVLNKYETLEKTINYVHGIGERVIDKWNDRDKLADGYYYIRTLWQVSGTCIYLNCFKSNGVFCLQLEYQSPHYHDYESALKQNLVITGLDMFYGF